MDVASQIDPSNVRIITPIGGGSPPAPGTQLVRTDSRLEVSPYALVAPDAAAMEADAETPLVDVRGEDGGAAPGGIVAFMERSTGGGATLVKRPTSMKNASPVKSVNIKKAEPMKVSPPMKSAPPMKSVTTKKAPPMKVAPKMKSAPQMKSTAMKAMKAMNAPVVKGAKIKPAKTVNLGCSRCRGSPVGCLNCRSPGFAGKRFQWK